MFRDLDQERLDGVATSFLSANGFDIDAEPKPQNFGPYVRAEKVEKVLPPEPPKPRLDWSVIPKRWHVPTASFFDLPRRIKEPQVCGACGGVEASKWSMNSCQRCCKRAARVSWIDRWEERFPDMLAGEALAASVDLYAPDGLVVAFQKAMDRRRDVEGYRAAAELHGALDFIRARDGKAALHKKGGRKTGPRGWNAREFYKTQNLPLPTVAEMRQLMAYPGHYGGAWMNNFCEWSEWDLRILWMLCHANQPLEKCGAILGRKPSAIAHRASDAGLRLSPQWRMAIAAPKAIKKPPLSTAYPYIAVKREEHTLLLMVNDFIPPGIPGREDACQALMLALLEGTVLPDALVGKLGFENRKRFVRAMRRENFEMSGFAVGLDDPIRDEHGSDTGFTLMGII